MNRYRLLVLVVLVVAHTWALGQQETDAALDAFLTESTWTTFNLDYNDDPGPLMFRSVPKCDGELVKEYFWRVDSFVVECHLGDQQVLVPFRSRFDTVLRYRLGTSDEGSYLDQRGPDTPWLRSYYEGKGEPDDLFGTWGGSTYRRVASNTWDYLIDIPKYRGTRIPEGSYLVRVIDENTLETDGTYGDDHIRIEIESPDLIRLVPLYGERSDARFSGDVILKRTGFAPPQPDWPSP